MRGQHPAGMLYRASFLPSVASDTAAQQTQAPAEPAAEAPAEQEPAAEAPERFDDLTFFSARSDEGAPAPSPTPSPPCVSWDCPGEMSSSAEEEGEEEEEEEEEEDKKTPKATGQQPTDVTSEGACTPATPSPSLDTATRPHPKTPSKAARAYGAVHDALAGVPAPVAEANTSRAEGETDKADDGVAAANKRMHWTSELQEAFRIAVEQLGGPKQATPTAILNKLGTEGGFTYSGVKNRLQRARAKELASAGLSAKGEKRPRDGDAADVPTRSTKAAREASVGVGIGEAGVPAGATGHASDALLMPPPPAPPAPALAQQHVGANVPSQQLDSVRSMLSRAHLLLGAMQRELEAVATQAVETADDRSVRSRDEGLHREEGAPREPAALLTSPAGRTLALAAAGGDEVAEDVIAAAGCEACARLMPWPYVPGQRAASQRGKE